MAILPGIRWRVDALCLVCKLRRSLLYACGGWSVRPDITGTLILHYTVGETVRYEIRIVPKVGMCYCPACDRVHLLVDGKPVPLGPVAALILGNVARYYAVRAAKY